MNTKLSLLSLVLVAGLVSSCATAERDLGGAGGGTVNVAFEQPERFTDLKRTYSAIENDRGYMDQLRQYIERTGSRRIPDGYVLDVTVTNIDLAGEFEPERGPGFSDVRVVKSIYPPRIDLTYRLAGPDGAVVSEGRRNLRNLGFDWTISGVDPNDPLKHEKRLLDDFLSDVAKQA